MEHKKCYLQKYLRRFETFHSEQKILPWQMKRIATGVSCIFIIVLFLLVLPRNAPFCEGFQGFVNVYFCCTLGKIGQDGASCCYLLVVKLAVTGKFLLLRIIFQKQFVHICLQEYFLLHQLPYQDNPLMPLLNHYLPTELQDLVHPQKYQHIF